jgi:RHS repeat-associated protein
MTTAAICATREVSWRPSFYRGEQYDSDLGLYYLRARYYNPATGRFLFRDPEDGDPTTPASLHKYLYANGDPVNQWHFGAKAHIGVDSKSGVIHSVCTSAASVSDVHMLPDLLHGEEKKVWGDAGYQGQTEAIHEAAPQAQDMTCRRVKTKQGVDENEKRRNRTKSRVRAKVEWPFRILKRVFGYTKVRYRGIKKNHEWLLTAFALINLYQHRKRLTPQLAPLGA